MSTFEPILQALADTGVRFVVVGGVAVVLHGHVRLTADLDVVVDFDPGPLREALRALCDLGLKPRAPVDPLDFAEPAQRRRWVEEKGMKVFSFCDETPSLREVDLFAEPPIPFEELWERSETVEIGSVSIRIASIEDLVTMKELSDRPQDRLDIEALRGILQEREQDGR